MKKIGLILSFYLILLAAIPCCAVDSCPDDKTEQTATHEKGDEDCGSCSPFFNCESCATATISHHFTQFNFETLPPQSTKAIYIEKQLPSIKYEFWQPPKIG